MIHKAACLVSVFCLMFGEDLAQKESPESYKEVMIPQMGLVKFPDSMTDAEIEAAILKGLLEGDRRRRKTSDNDLDHFRLFANCRPMRLTVEELHSGGIVNRCVKASGGFFLRSVDRQHAINELHTSINLSAQLWRFEATKSFLSHHQHLPDHSLGVDHLLEPFRSVRSQA